MSCRAVIATRRTGSGSDGSELRLGVRRTTMKPSVVRVAWYRFRVTFRRRLGSYLALVLLVGLVGGIALGSIAAGRRTQSSFPAFVAGVNPPALSGISAVLNPDLGSPGYNAA